MCDTVRQGAMGQALWYWLPVALYAGTIFYLSSQSHPEEQLPSLLFEEVSDKVLHGVEYAVLGGLCYRAFRWGANGQVASQALLFAVIAASLYGITDEVHQFFVPFRESSWQDWLADTAGAVIGAMSWRAIRSE
jgi:VanZ family protein